MIPINALGVLGTGLLLAECYFPKTKDALYYCHLKVADDEYEQKALLASSTDYLIKNSLILEDVNSKYFKNLLNKKKINQILCDLPQDLLKIFSFSLMLSTIDFYFTSANNFQPYSVVVKTVLCFFSAITILRATCLYGKEMYRQSIMFEKARSVWVNIHTGKLV
jgi:hypothetical protein